MHIEVGFEIRALTSEVQGARRSKLTKDLPEYFVCNGRIDFVTEAKVKARFIG